MRKTKAWMVVAGMAVLVASTAACGDDDEATGTDDSEAYCALAKESDEQEEFPTAEQFEEFQAVAPAEIEDEIDAVVPVIVQAIEDGDPFAAFEDPIVEENLPAIEAYEEETCGLGDEDDEEASGEIDPEFADYCAISIELDEQEDFPNEEQLTRLRANLPNELAEPGNLVIDAFLANLDDPFAAFADPAVEAAFEPIEAFDAEHCGLAEDEDEEEQDPSVTELDPSAAQVAVTAAEYSFELTPAAPAAGRTSFTMTNVGDERHVMVLFKIAEGATMDDVLASEGDEGTDGPELESDSAAAGETAVLTTDLEPGTYGMICYIPAPDGQPHLMKGMTKEFTVA